jgi:hypothetical protein
VAMLKVELVDWETWFELGLEGKCPLLLFWKRREKLGIYRSRIDIIM